MTLVPGHDVERQVPLTSYRVSTVQFNLMVLYGVLHTGLFGVSITEVSGVFVLQLACT